MPWKETRALEQKVKYFNDDYEEDSTVAGLKKCHYISAPNGLSAILSSNILFPTKSSEGE